MNADNPQQAYFLSLETVPTPVWYWLGIGSIAASLLLRLRGRSQDALFVGQSPLCGGYRRYPCGVFIVTAARMTTVATTGQAQSPCMGEA